MKKHLLSFLMVLLPMVASAYDASVNGLYYNLNAETKTAEVTKGDYKQVGSVTIPETITIGATTYTVTSIGDEAFELCKNLNSVTIPSTINRIGKNAFYQCLEMTSVNIPSSVTEIDEWAFRYCWKLTTIDLPNSVTKISDGVFMDCQSLENITIPSTITSIGKTAFRRCYHLTAIILPYGVVSIGASAFLDCSRLSTIYLPESIVSVGQGAFKDIPWYNNQPDGLLYVGKVAYEFKGTMEDNTSLGIKDGTTEISGQAFYGCKGLVAIQIPESVKAIGENAFCNCSNLRSVNLPTSLKEIDNGTFSSCQNLTSIILPDGLTRIGSSAFQNCGLTSISFPEKLTTIESNAFASCNGIETIQIPASVESIGASAFENKSLKSISIAAGNSVYDSRNNCNAIIETATNTLLWGCQGSFVPDGVEKIEVGAFGGCEGLTSIIIPASVKTIGKWAFASCPLLASVTLNEGLMSLETQAFSRCSALGAITLPSTLTEIGEFAFSGTNLANINSLIVEPFAIDASVFQSLYSSATLYVPDGTKAKYQNVEAWKQFNNIIEVIKQCEPPTITYEKGKLKYECATEGANFLTSISDSDIKSHLGSVVNLTATYMITVIATATGYKDSEPATATLCWIDVEPKTEGIEEDAVTEVKALPVLIQSHGGTISVQGLDAGTEVFVYTTDGKQQGSAMVVNGATTIHTSLQPGSIAVVKIGEKSVKVLLK